MLTGTSGCTASKLNSPYEILRHGDTFFIADGGNQRVLEFDTIPTATGATANAVLGQSTFTSCLQNKGNALPSASSLAFPNALAAKGNLLAVSDHTNNRTMFFDLPVITDQSASKQLGQPDFVTATNVTPPTAQLRDDDQGVDLRSAVHLDRRRREPAPCRDSVAIASGIIQTSECGATATHTTRLPGLGLRMSRVVWRLSPNFCNRTSTDG